MVEYWNCGELPWPNIEEFVDQNVGAALKEYVEDSGNLIITWHDEPEPCVSFWAGDSEFEYKEKLIDILIYELNGHRPGGLDDADLCFNSEGDRRVILMQELVRTYLKWKEGGVHVAKEEP